MPNIFIGMALFESKNLPRVTRNFPEFPGFFFLILKIFFWLFPRMMLHQYQTEKILCMMSFLTIINKINVLSLLCLI